MKYPAKEGMIQGTVIGAGLEMQDIIQNIRKSQYGIATPLILGAQLVQAASMMQMKVNRIRATPGIVFESAFKEGK